VVAGAPIVAAAACGPAIAWFRHGSIAAVDWMPYAALVALLVAAAALSGSLGRPSRAVWMSVGALAGLAVWQGVSAVWAAAPNLARDEAALTSVYAVTLLVAALLPADGRARLRALEATCFVLGGYTVACALRFRFGAHPVFGEGRAADPISYINAGAALWALGFWPGVALAARRSSAPVVRALSLGTAAIALAGVITAQSKGAVLGLVVSAFVVFGVAGRRTRLAVPAAIALAISLLAATTLTAPYRARPERLAGAIRGVGTSMLLVAFGAVIAGGVYALADRRLSPSPSTVRRTGAAAATIVLAALVLALAAFLAPHPLREVQHEWRAAHHSAVETSSTHFAALGSNRLDFWRVALDGGLAHPLAGSGARGFGPYYLQHGRSPETPARAHSLPLEVFLEEGLVGLALLAAGIGALVWMLVSGARARRVTSIAGLGAVATGLAQMCVDWTWTFPAVGLPLFVLAGLGLETFPSALPRIPSRLIGATAIALAAIVFLPTYLSARIATQAVIDRAPGRLVWSSRLDPLSPAADLSRYALAATPEDRLAAARRLVQRQPRGIAYQYLYGEALLAVGKTAEARDALRRALALHPGDTTVERALGQAGGQ
jgi:hypothetical protein